MHFKPLALAAVIAASLTIVGCGGGGGGSEPAPTPTPTPTPTPSPTPSPTPTPGPTAEALDNEYVDYLTDLTDGIILPGYLSFQTESAKMVTQAESFCALTSPTQQDLDALRTQWVEMTKAWQNIRFVNVGQITQNTNLFRIQLFPDDNNAVARGVDDFLIEPGTVTADFISNKNAGGQGIPALEYLLYPAEDGDSLLTASNAAKRCEVVEAIANNMANITKEVYDAWSTSGGNFRQQLISGAAPFTSIRDSVGELVTNWLEILAITKDEKMLYVLTDNAPGRPETAEHFRSDVSLQMVEVNLLSIRAFYTNLDGKGLDTIIVDTLGQNSINEQMMTALDASVAAIQKVNQTYSTYNEVLTTTQGRADLTEVIDRMRDVRDLLVADLEQVLDINIGFNALDGD